MCEETKNNLKKINLEILNNIDSNSLGLLGNKISEKNNYYTQNIEKLFKDYKNETAFFFRNNEKVIPNNIAEELSDYLTTQLKFRLNDKLKIELYEDYDPDSSTFAWKYYKKIYNQKIEIKNTLIKKRGKQPDENPPLLSRSGTRLIFKEYSFNNSKHCVNIAGDCSFNFNDDKYGKFMDIIEEDSELKSELKDGLDFCAMMHHSPLNFALMPVTGALNCVKGRAGTHDRLDKFLYNLNDYYSNCRDDHNILTGQSYLGNREALKGFLLDVQGDEVEKRSNTTEESAAIIEPKNSCAVKEVEIQVGTRNYVKLFYPWVNDELLESLVENGQHPITDADKLNTYMNFAIKYWFAASEYYSKIIITS